MEGKSAKEIEERIYYLQQVFRALFFWVNWSFKQLEQWRNLHVVCWKVRGMLWITRCMGNFVVGIGQWARQLDTDHGRAVGLVLDGWAFSLSICLSTGSFGFRKVEREFFFSKTRERSPYLLVLPWNLTLIREIEPTGPLFGSGNNIYKTCFSVVVAPAGLSHA